jgi:hypothetical protein
MRRVRRAMRRKGNAYPSKVQHSKGKAKASTATTMQRTALRSCGQGDEDCGSAEQCGALALLRSSMIGPARQSKGKAKLAARRAAQQRQSMARRRDDGHSKGSAQLSSATRRKGKAQLSNAQRRQGPDCWRRKAKLCQAKEKRRLEPTSTAKARQGAARWCGALQSEGTEQHYGELRSTAKGDTPSSEMDLHINS